MTNSIIDALVKDYISNKSSKKEIVDKIKNHFNMSFIQGMNEFSKSYERLINGQK